MIRELDGTAATLRTDPHRAHLWALHDADEAPWPTDPFTATIALPRTLFTPAAFKAYTVQAEPGWSNFPIVPEGHAIDRCVEVMDTIGFPLGTLHVPGLPSTTIEIPGATVATPDLALSRLGVILAP